eukprot:TRINITY_DN5690_c0_g1_i1.p1 TRINITY_DN5690_c0_g1~~TRINITY_DN5690_c0_g1_i1.p1  ORF type:complete len:193 (+),score=51.31 TRINITY_DN5690_c0_g1_i1:107-685(+)
MSCFRAQQGDKAGHTAVALEKVLVPLMIVDVGLLAMAVLFMIAGAMVPLFFATLLLSLGLHIMGFVAAVKRSRSVTLMYFVGIFLVTSLSFIFSMINHAFYMERSLECTNTNDNSAHVSWWIFALVFLFLFSLLGLQIAATVLAFKLYRRLRKAASGVRTDEEESGSGYLGVPVEQPTQAQAIMMQPVESAV